MPNKTSQRLEKNIEKILELWEERVNVEVKAARHQGAIELRNSLPEYLVHLVTALSDTVDRTSARKKSDKIEATRLGKKHGEDRAGSRNYTMGQLITEFHILRQVIFDVLEEEIEISPLEREVIVCSIEQAVNDAASEFNLQLKNLQDKETHTLAHDLRSPLTSSKITAQLVLRKLDKNDFIFDKLKLIISNIDRIDHMVGDLLDASRLRAGENIPVKFMACDFDTILREVATELNVAYPGSFNIQSTECQGYWDANGIRRVIENLVTNAVKYGADNTPVTMSLNQNDQSVTFSVHNWGNPIPHEKQSIIFEEFQRLENSDNKIGWGVGLTLVKSMVLAHHGTIKVESEKDTGTTFIIELPKDPREIKKEYHLPLERPDEINTTLQ